MVKDDECEPHDEYSRCSCCAEKNKLKHCNFCGNLTCPAHLDHQRPYPVNNVSRTRHSNSVCLACNSKFLYRDAMFEMMTRIELIDAETEFYQNEQRIAE